ncbi:hypothetical protein [Opitutus sp. GAS368]|uniref:hypothetical protein n=1 Tax=Opitutus sp. GAS368 TaxID=1882749 RepID=UPI0012FDBBF9|nr:hypothetical protein [Opitutus sp. GAS368]
MSAWRLAGLLLVVTPGVAQEKAPAADPAAGAIITRWLEALGGARKIAQLTTVDYHCQIDFGNGQPPLETEVRADIRAGYRYDYVLPRYGRLTQAFDGRQAWQRNAELGFGQLSAQDHTMNLSALDFRAPAYTFQYFPVQKRLPDETIDGRKLQVVELAAQSGVRAKWFFDPETGLRVRLEADVPGGRMVVECSDFRTVPGIGLKEPFRVKRTLGGRTTLVILRDIIYNEATDRELFTPSRAAMEDDQQVERLMQNNRLLMGQEAMKQVQTRVTRELVEITTSGVKLSATVSQKRPNLMVVERETPGMGPSAEGYNGQVGWAWSELQGSRTLQGAELQQLLGNADLEGPLRLSEQCPLRRMLEEKEDHGRRIVGIAMATLAGPVGNFYFDVNTSDIVRVESFMQAGPDGQLKVTADLSDFRKVDGVRLPFRTIIDNPAMHIITTIESVRHNVPLDDAIFQPRKD